MAAFVWSKFSNEILLRLIEWS
ncbi:hypothetical protein Patl1_34359 [Pistacia atlantica]|uniref:Uncharacterized protein n=1 Tax=Pistacia atlantica TaxID=434234 RepID=A0ACC0ZRS0_9ROSI|nr:hypothetical protein Patl1_34359 [Pistacia atlantica]